MHWSYAENLANECTNNRNATINVCGWKVKADSNTLRTDHENRDRKTEYNGQSSRRILFRVTLSEVGSRLSSIIQIGWFFFLFFYQQHERLCAQVHNILPCRKRTTNDCGHLTTTHGWVGEKGRQATDNRKRVCCDSWGAAAAARYKPSIQSEKEVTEDKNGMECNVDKSKQ